MPLRVPIPGSGSHQERRRAGPDDGAATGPSGTPGARLDLGIEGGTDPAHLGLAQRGDPKGLDEVFHPAR